MKKILIGFSIRRVILSITLFILMITILITISLFTSQNSIESNIESKGVAKFIENIISKFFIIDHNDFFWRVELNLLLRKVAHFLEYMILGMIGYAFFNMVLFNLRQAAVVSGSICLTAALIDEFRQFFVSGRNPQIFDVMIDTCGALFGIILVMITFVLIKVRNKKRGFKIP